MTGSMGLQIGEERQTLGAKAVAGVHGSTSIDQLQSRRQQARQACRTSKGDVYRVHAAVDEHESGGVPGRVYRPLIAERGEPSGVRRPAGLRRARRPRGRGTLTRIGRPVHREHVGRAGLDHRAHAAAHQRARERDVGGAGHLRDSQALGFRLQTVGLPMQFSDAAPYLTTLGVMVWLGIRAKRSRQEQPAR
jgi:hypothetical protein